MIMTSSQSDRCSAEQVFNLCERLNFGDGPSVGKPIVLRPFQREIITGVCDPQIQIASIWMPKKNSKTMMAALLILSHLLHGLMCRISPEVYSGSGTGINQAALVFRAVAGFIYQMPALQGVLWVRENIYKIQSRDHTNPGFYKCIVADDDKLDGPNPSLFVMDEIHRGGKKTGAIWDTMINGQVQRPCPLAVSISTAGAFDPESAAWQLYDRTKKIQSGVYCDPSFLPVVYEHKGEVPWADGEDAIYAAYAKVNPAAGDFIPEAGIRNRIRKAIELPSKRPNFERYFLGIWTNDAETFLAASDWTKDQVPFDVDELDGRTCYLGGDLAWAEDMSSVIAVFPMDDGTYRLLAWYWVPGESIAKRVKLSGAPLDHWVDAGLVNTFPGGVTDFDVIFEHVESLTKRYDVKSLGHDPVGTADIWKRCSDELGIDVMKWSPKPWSMNDPTRAFEAAVMESKIQHNDNPVLAWNVSNALAKEDNEQRIVLVKRTRNQNIDGLIGAILGHAMSKRVVEQKGKKRRKINATEAFAL